MKPLRAMLGCTLVLVLASPAAGQGVRLSVDEDTWLQFGFLAQLQYELADGTSGANGEGWGSEFFARRLRIMGRGSVHKKVKFWFSTDVPNAGRSGAPNTIIWNDGFVDLQLAPEFNIAVGRFLVPFGPENRASPATSLGIDYNLNAIKIPTYADRAFWRDDGIEVRGMLFDGLIDYRGGVFRGERTYNVAGPDDPVQLNNPDRELRTMGMVMLNFADPQPGWFYNPNSLGALKVLSVGAGYDRIPNSAPDRENSRAWSVFAVVEQPVGKGRVNLQATYYDWDGTAWTGGFEGTTIGAQLGYLVPGEMAGGLWQPVVRFQRQDNPDAEFTLNTYNLGLNYFLKKHAFNIKLDYAISERMVGGEGVDAFRIQTQLLF
jgi:hypothetical protein